MSHKAISVIVLACVTLLCVAAAAFAPAIKESFEKPDHYKVRSYRMSLLTDAQVIELHARAAAENKKQLAAAEEADKAFWTERSRAMSEGEANPATKLRDPFHCNPPIPLGMISGGNKDTVASADALFEAYVMGVCAYIDNVREAKQHHCLPQ